MRFRQIHLDNHTSPLIPDIGVKFDKEHWQTTLKNAAVDSVTLFATCHHGCAYYDTEFGNRHPNLKFDLLRAQMDACHEIDIATPVYITAGFNDWAFYQHPEWGQKPYGAERNDLLKPGFKLMCFNSPYLDFLCSQIREVVSKYPDADGIFLDIIIQCECCCPYCVRDMLKQNLNPQDSGDRKRFAHQVIINYMRRAAEAARSNDKNMRVFHNSGHIGIDNYDILPYYSHLELESLPTGGWGYDHFPMSAAYCRNLGFDFLGMTGKFHTTWGEFGGLKTPEALRYECAAMLAQNACCSIGDQYHPSGKLDESTYEIIGRAYREVREKEAWCRGAKSAAVIAILSSVVGGDAHLREVPGDIGASRLLLESHIPFDIVDHRMDWSQYRVLILPDNVLLTPELAEKLEDFRAAGGRLVLSGKSGMGRENGEFMLKGLPFVHEGESPFEIDYLKAESEYVPDYVRSPFVMYLRSERIKKSSGVSLGRIYDPYFNRTFEHYSSHQHTPYIDEATEYDCGVMSDDVLYFAHPVFSIYRSYGQVVLKEYIAAALRKFLGEDEQVRTNMPSQGRVTLMQQPGRRILHALYANSILRGGRVEVSGGNAIGRAALEVIDELNPCPPVTFSVKTDEPVSEVLLVPQGEAIPFRSHEGRVEFELPSFICHQMVELKN